MDTASAHDPNRLPAGLPVPRDDGAADHLPGLELPKLPLPGTSGAVYDLAAESRDRWVTVFVYPRTGRPGAEPPGGEDGWDRIPGARGCTPQCRAYSRALAEFAELGVAVYGLSVQDTAYQREAAERLALEHELLSDAEFAWTRALRLPTFEVAGERLLRRLTLFLRNGRVEHVRYPVFPPDGDAAESLRALRVLRARAAPER